MQKINRSKWNDLCKMVNEQMSDHVKHFVTPISKVLEDQDTRKEYGIHHGSGSFIEIDNSKYLITNEHVAKSIKSTSLAHQFYDSDKVVRLTNHFATLGYPEDVAITKIDEKAWNIDNHKAKTISSDRILSKHNPVKGEMLFTIGYSGERAKFTFNNMINPGTPYLTQEMKYPGSAGDENYHFYIHYNPDKAIKLEENSKGLPKPPGISGSLVWNTRFVECQKSQKKWAPQEAKVTGIIRAWDPDNKCLLVTKADHLHIFELSKQLNK